MPTKANEQPPVPSPTVIGGAAFGDVLDELDRPKVPWNPQPGSKIVGRIVGIVTARSEYGSYPLVTLDPGPGEPLVDVHCFHTWLKSDVIRAELRDGDILGIKYVDRDGPRNAARYRIQVKRTGRGEAYRPGIEMSDPTDKLEQAFEEPF